MKGKREAKSATGPVDTREFDQEFVVDTFQPLSEADRKRWKRIRAKAARPERGSKRGKIAVHVERSLLDKVDTLATKLRVSREKLIARGIKALLAATDH